MEIYTVQAYLSIKDVSLLERRFLNLEPILQMYVREYNEIKVGVQNIEAGQDILNNIKDEMRILHDEAMQIIKSVESGDSTYGNDVEAENSFRCIETILRIKNAERNEFSKCLQDHVYARKRMEILETKIQTVKQCMENIISAVQLLGG